MSDTLTALHAAITAAPADRTVRLVYADALDESGDPLNAARAEFIRAQIRLEVVPEDDPVRAALAARCGELFADHWIDWWRPVCAAVGLPEPYVPTRRLRERVRRLVGRETRQPGAPYRQWSNVAGVCSVNSADHGFTAQFVAGFPEVLYVHQFTMNTLTGGFGTWITGAPFGRLWFAMDLSEFEWDSVDGPHLANVSELVFDQLSEAVAARAARSVHLRHLVALRAHSLPVAIVRELIARPAWTGLRSLTLTGAAPPDVIRALAEHCTLHDLESLTFDIPTAVPLFSMVLPPAVARVLTVLPMREPIRWRDYWPALDALARSPVLARLRTFRVRDAGAPGPDDIYEPIVPPPPPLGPDELFPDPLVGALADGLNADRLVRLELPAARIAPAGRADLVRRFGARAVLV